MCYRLRQLNKKVTAALLSYAYLAGLALVVVTVDLVLGDRHRLDADSVTDVIFLCAAGPLLNVPQVRIEQGRLSLSGIAIGAAALTCNPLNATLIGLASSASFFRRGAFPILGNAIFTAAISLSGSLAAMWMARGGSLPVVARLGVLAICFVVNIIVVAVAFRIRIGESLVRVLQHNFS